MRVFLDFAIARWRGGDHRSHIKPIAIAVHTLWSPREQGRGEQRRLVGRSRHRSTFMLTSLRSMGPRRLISRVGDFEWRLGAAQWSFAAARARPEPHCARARCGRVAMLQSSHL